MCQKCHKNPATVRYAEVVNGKVMDLHLCSECLAKHQENAASGFELAAPGAKGQAARAEHGQTRSRRACTACGTHLTTIVDTGRTGCSACYGTFQREIEPLLDGLHGANTHLGKSPKMDDVRVKLRATLQTKRALLRSAVLSEHFEDAAELRDNIRQIEAELGLSESERE